MREGTHITGGIICCYKMNKCNEQCIDARHVMLSRRHCNGSPANTDIAQNDHSSPLIPLEPSHHNLIDLALNFLKTSGVTHSNLFFHKVADIARLIQCKLDMFCCEATFILFASVLDYH